VNREHYDLIIIGTGSGNTIITSEFDSWKIAIIEKGIFGGTCLNRGCIPSKMLVHVANTICEIERGELIGVDASVNGLRWKDIVNRIYGRIDPIAEGGEQYRENLPNVTVYKGHAKFVDNKVIEVNGIQLCGHKIVVATGAKPFIPPIPGLSEIPYQTSDSIMRLDSLPKSLSIIGGGYIATEIAHIFSSFGCRVTVFARGPRLLRGQDKEIGLRFTESFRNKVDVHLNVDFQDIFEDESAGVSISCLTPLGHVSLSSEMLLVATGRTPTADELNLDSTDVSTECGYIVTDENMRTSVDEVFALGDVTNPYQLKHSANAEARVVSHNLIDPDNPISVDLDPMPYAIFSNPQIASVGATEEDLLESQTEYVKGVADYSEVAYGWAMENTDGFCKVLACPHTGKILGAHIMGPQASTLIHQLIQGMKFGQGVQELSRGMLYVHPALNEVVEVALLKANDSLH
tara:strand:- start:1902 stop:3281 length:1380 start_codon:yes stop_codon:yes gene_type:complete